ncbi:MAG: tRNA 2-selenouridine(34) synthase MnmH [Alphaproteobacteria bacterium]|nr:tRNA 2-selenouridine(34) synthase MnmH [Alphaproteobacteria bacterium]
MKLTETDDFQSLFLNDVPLMDVRAPVEFAKGAFPGAVNLPLLNDDERHRIGITYKEEGQDAAVRLGHELVSGDVKAARVESWLDFARKNPRGCLFCFRGGMRSHIVQQWMAEAGVDYPLVTGGYKALRRYLIDTLDHLVATRDFIVIGGRTGNGKTLLVHDLKNAVDLEGLARHRGSSFGARIAPQPSQIDFENALAVQMLKLGHASEKPLFIEDEGRIVGRCALPPDLLAGLQQWPLALLDEDLGTRIANVQKDYVTDLLEEYRAAYGDEGFAQFSDFLRQSLDRIRKRLGGLRHKQVRELLDKALERHEQSGDESLHRAWIEELLVKYYDPMYEYQLSQKQGRVVFRGTRAEVLEWCRAR